jgi:tRNA threonylcarbamoyladenosine biosynthesis protein TsaB
MRILGFDTATAATTVALLDLDGHPGTNPGTDPGTHLELELRDDPAAGERPRHVTRLLPLIAELFERSGAGWEAVDVLAVGVGPGTFTGLRIGIATAQALGRACSIPLAGVSTLRSLALGAASTAGAADPGAVVLGVLDARRGEAFAAAWRLGLPGAGALGEQLAEARALTPDALAGVARELGPNALAVGPGAIEFRVWLERAGAVVPAEHSELHKVSATYHCRLASLMSTTAATAEISPDYLRLPDAEIALQRRAQDNP